MLALCQIPFQVVNKSQAQGIYNPIKMIDGKKANDMIPA